MSEIPNDPTFKKYADYLVDNYIGENSNFPPNIYSAFKADFTRSITIITVNLSILTSM